MEPKRKYTFKNCLVALLNVVPKSPLQNMKFHHFQADQSGCKSRTDFFASSRPPIL